MKHEVAHIICKADPSGPAKEAQVTKITMRTAVKTLLDRSLLQGSVAAGVKMHVSNDIVFLLFEYLVSSRIWSVS